jgi:hypothetical protein
VFIGFVELCKRKFVDLRLFFFTSALIRSAVSVTMDGRNSGLAEFIRLCYLIEICYSGPVSVRPSGTELEKRKNVGFR